jgi:hypothetical protein
MNNLLLAPSLNSRISFIYYFTIWGDGEKRNLYRILVGKPKGKRPLGRKRNR